MSFPELYERLDTEKTWRVTTPLPQKALEQKALV